MPLVINTRTASRNQIRHVNGCGASHSGVTNGTSRKRLSIPALPDLNFVFPVHVIASGKNRMAMGGYAHATYREMANLKESHVVKHTYLPQDHERLPFCRNAEAYCQAGLSRFVACSFCPEVESSATMIAQ